MPLPGAPLRTRIAITVLMRVGRQMDPALLSTSKKLTPYCRHDHCLPGGWTEDATLGRLRLRLLVDNLEVQSGTVVRSVIYHLRHQGDLHQGEMLLMLVRVRCRTELGIDLGLLTLKKILGDVTLSVNQTQREAADRETTHLLKYHAAIKTLVMHTMRGRHPVRYPPPPS